MSAPALVVLARGSRDARASATVAALVEEVRLQRPDLRVTPAFVGSGGPGLATVVGRLAARGHDEVVVVPLLLTTGDAQVATAVAEAASRHPALTVGAADALGLEPVLLGVLDQRLRAALRSSRVNEVDALVLAGSGSADATANQAVSRLARRWGARHRLPVLAAFACATPPASGEAVRALRAEGRRHVAVGSLFLAPGPLSARVRELAVEAGAVAVSAPLGAHPEVARAVLARYAVGAVGLVPV